MGKGSRNRNLHMQNSASNPRKNNRPKQAPKWILPTVTLLMVAVILFIAVASIVSSSGIVERNRILIKSQTGKFDVSQQMATFIAWQNAYYLYYYYYNSSSQSDTSLKGYSSADEFALSAAQYTLQNNLRDAIQDEIKVLIDYVAVCDEAYRQNITLDENDQKSVDDSMQSLKNMQTSLGYTSFGTFLKVAIREGIKESDVRKAMEMVVLYDKYKTQIEDGYKAAMTPTDLDNHLKDHPEDYYKIDYVTFAADNEELATRLKEAKDLTEFRELIVKNHHTVNYGKVFCSLLAADEYVSIETATNNNGGTSLTDALNAIGAEETKTYNRADMPDTQKALKDWLFSTSRKQYETKIITTDGGIYIAAFMSLNANTETVEARVKFYDYANVGGAYQNDETFKDTILETLLAEKRAEILEAELNRTDVNVDEVLKANNAIEAVGITPESDLPEAILEQVFELAGTGINVYRGLGNGMYYVIYIRNLSATTADIAYCAFGTPVTKYLSASEKADDLKDLTKAENADINAIMIENGAVEKADVTKSTPKTEVPEAVVNAALGANAKAGSVRDANGNGVYYVIYIKEKTNDKATISYVSFENDFYYDVFGGLSNGLDEKGAYPSTKSIAAYAPDAETGTYQAWLSQVKEGTLESALDAYATTSIESKDSDGKTVYNVYMALEGRMYMSTAKVIDGAYLQVSAADGKTAAELAAEHVEAIKGKTGDALTRALAARNANTVIKSNFSYDALPTNTELKDWMFSEERQANDVKVFTSGSTTHIAIYLESMESWRADAEVNYVTDMTEGWIADLAQHYTADERALDRIGETSTTATTAVTTDTATTAAA